RAPAPREVEHHVLQRLGLPMTDLASTAVGSPPRTGARGFLWAAAAAGGVWLAAVGVRSMVHHDRSGVRKPMRLAGGLPRATGAVKAAAGGEQPAVHGMLGPSEARVWVPTTVAIPAGPGRSGLPVAKRGRQAAPGEGARSFSAA